MLNQGSTQWARPPAYDRACLAVVAITPHAHYDSRGRWGSTLSDEELLRTIDRDMRSSYTDIIRPPLPPIIKATLAHIDDEKSRATRLTNLPRTGPKLV